MKKALLILLAALVCLTGVACKKKEATDGSEKQTQQTSGTSAPIMTGSTGTTDNGAGSLSTPILTNPTPQPSETDISVFSYENVSVYLRSVKKSSYTTKFDFFVSNSGDLPIIVTLNILTVNGYVFQESIQKDLIPCSATVASLSILNSQLDSAGISEISEIVLQISAMDSSFNTVFDQTVTFAVEN